MSNSARAVLGVTIIWVAVIFATTIVLKGTPFLGRMVPILGGGAAGTLFILIRALRRVGGNL